MSSEHPHRTVNVPKLKGPEDYRHWARKAKNLLKTLHLWVVIEPTEEDLKAPGFADKDEEAKANLTMTIDDNLLDHTDEDGSAREMWELFRKMFGVAGFSAKYRNFSSTTIMTLCQNNEAVPE